MPRYTCAVHVALVVQSLKKIAGKNAKFAQNLCEKLHSARSQICAKIARHAILHEKAKFAQKLHPARSRFSSGTGCSVVDRPYTQAAAGWCTKRQGTAVDAVCCADVGAPIVLSQPHFYQADPSYQHAIDGLAPNETYLTYLDVEPVSKRCCYKWFIVCISSMMTAEVDFDQSLSYRRRCSPSVCCVHRTLATCWKLRRKYKSTSTCRKQKLYGSLCVGSRRSDHYFRSVCLSVCLCRVFLSRLWSDLDQTWTYVIRLGLVVSPRV